LDSEWVRVKVGSPGTAWIMKIGVVAAWAWQPGQHDDTFFGLLFIIHIVSTQQQKKNKAEKKDCFSVKISHWCIDTMEVQNV
jgi:hypothetical protein